MQIELWWLWMVLAALFLVGEIFTAGFFLLWFSIGAAVAGILAMLGIGESGQLIVFIIVSIILFVSGRRFAERVTTKQPPGVGADRFVGGTGIVLEKIDPVSNTGCVRIGQEPWRAKSDGGHVIPPDTIVKVVHIDGAHAVVRVIEKEK
jgi:membrane protein implicated in regulation of membrane protease activity